MTETNPVLYILMRNDLPSMNPGKGMAQSSHASNAFEKVMTSHRAKLGRGDMDNDELEIMRPIIGMADSWKTQTNQGFGTVLVLTMNEYHMRSVVGVADAVGLVAAVVHDDSYPILVPPELGLAIAAEQNPVFSMVRVGEKPNYVTIPLDTCAYVFGDKNDPTLQAILGHFPLHP